MHTLYNWKIIDQKKAQLDKARPFPPNTLKSLQKKLNLEWTYHSNAIEGNTLTLKETKVVLEGITIGGKTVKEHLEALNHNKALQYLYTLVKKNKPINQRQIKQIHSLILNKIDPAAAGAYRQENIMILGAKHIPPRYKDVPNKMRKLIASCQTQWRRLHPAERAGYLHIELVKIHPFVDGNGRTARLVQNLELMKAGFPPIVIKKENRLKYYKALDKAHTARKPADFIKLSVHCLNQSLNLYLNTLK